MKHYEARCVLLALVMVCGNPARAQHAEPSKQPEDLSYRDCVVVVLDASGSMGDPMRGTPLSRMEGAKAALKQVLARVPPSTEVGVLVFSGRNVADPWVRPLGPKPSAAELAAAIDPIQPEGLTPLGMFIKVGADRLLQQRDRQFGYGSYRLLIVTDGEATDPSALAAYAPDVLLRGITVDVIGVDMDQQHSLATTAHSYRRADDPASLERAVAEVFAEVSAAHGDAPVAQDTFDLTAGLAPELALEMITALAGSGNHSIGGRPPKTEEPAPGDQAAAAGQAPVSAKSPQQKGPSQPARTPAPSGDGGLPSFVWFVIAAVVVTWVLRTLKRKS